MTFSNKLFKQSSGVSQVSAPAGLSSGAGERNALPQSGLSAQSQPEPAPQPTVASPAPATAAPPVQYPAAPVVQFPNTVGPVYAAPLQPVQRQSTLLITALICAVIVLGALQFRSLIKIMPDPDGADGLHVLLMYESDPDEGEATDDQKLSMSAKMVGDWLKENCGKDSTGKPAWRILDDDTNLEHDDPAFAKMAEKKRKSEPWLYMSGGGREISEPMVDGKPEEFIEQLEKGK